MNSRCGVALVMALAAVVLVESLALLALHAAVIRERLVADARWRIEGALVAAGALATVRVGHHADLDTLSDGATLVVPMVTRIDGWSWSARVARTGALLRVTVSVARRASDGSIFAARQASLLLTHDPADTVRVLARRARF